MMTFRRSTTEIEPMFRIGEVAKITGLTTRTLRYWEELGLVHPSGYGSGGDRQILVHGHGSGHEDPGSPETVGVLAG